MKVSSFREHLRDYNLTKDHKLNAKAVKEQKNKLKDNEAMHLFDEIFAELKEEKPDVTVREAMCAWDWKLRCLDGEDRFGSEGVVFDIEPLEVSDDIKLEFGTPKSGLFNIWFNTWFIHDNRLEFSKMELDKGFKDEKNFAPNFKVILHFDNVQLKKEGEPTIPVCQVGVRNDIPLDFDGSSNKPELLQNMPIDPEADPALCLLEDTEVENPKHVKAPTWYPLYHTSLNFKNFQKISEHLISAPDCEQFNLPKNEELIKTTTREPLEVSRSVLYSIIQLYLRSGHYGRCFDYHIELIVMDNMEGVKLFTQQASELAAISLDKLKPEELEPFWLNVYHTMLLHYLLYSKHRPNPEFKETLSNYKKFTYKIGEYIYSLYEVLMGCIRAPWPKDSSIDKPIVYDGGNPKSRYVVKVPDPMIGCLISFGTTTSPGIWMYSAEEFEQQKEIAVNTYLVRQSAALGQNKNLYLMSNMRLFAKDYGGEKRMKERILQLHGLNEKETSKWSLKYQDEDLENRVILDHLIAQNVVITHNVVNYYAQAHLFIYQKPTVKNPKF